ncbi:MAG: putative HLH transcription factor [Lentinula lateritia]|nr:MAG: putative HLH transcription factor [Lentinula lateritia]
MQSPLMPPVPYADFQLSFDPQLSNLFPHPPQLPPSAELFSPSETNELFNFLDGFDGSIWDTEPDSLDHHSFGLSPESPRLPPHSPYSNPHLKTVPKPNPAAPLSRPRRTARVKPGRTAHRNTSKSSSHTSSSTTPPALSFDEPSSPMLDNTSTQSTLTQSRASARTKTLLFITLLAPSGNAPALGMPTRGRPKGSGSRAKAGKKVGNDADGAKGKSGVLFRAVEYCRWLEEGREALRKEVAKVEAAADLTGT